MNIDFATQEVSLKENSSIEITESFRSDIQSADVCLKGFTLNYHHDDVHDHGEGEDPHVASVELELVAISGNQVTCKVSATTPKNATIDKRNARVLFIVTY